MIWSILVATLARRSDLLARVMSDLAPQMPPGGVEVVAYRNHGEIPLCDIRQALVEDAHGDYLCFVDDDDRLPPYYVDMVLPLLDGTVDYVGWRMQAYVHGQPLKPTYHTLDAGGWWETDQAYYRDVSHLNPVRTELARCCDFRRGVVPEDVSWSDQMRTYVKTQHLCGDQIMYHYYATTDSTWHPGHEPAWDGTAEPLPDYGWGWFRWHGAST